MQALAHPCCHGMQELGFAKAERELLNRVIAATSSNSLHHATDVIQLHILQSLAVTAGSAFGCSPPSKAACWDLFVTPHDKKDKQSMQMHRGGRAFTKHAIRASNGWWGVSTGTNADKNAAAEACFERIWEQASWRNVFWLPHRVLAFELRVQEGYGMRYQKEARADWTFRGFVEPAMAGDAGHPAKWRH